MSKIRMLLRGLSLAILIGAGCAENSKVNSDSAKSTDRPIRKRFMLENQGTRIEVSIPKAEGESASGTYRARVMGPSGSAQTLVGDREGFLRDAWFVDVGNDDDTQLVVWVQPESGDTQLDWYEEQGEGWQHRSLATPRGSWIYDIRRGVLFATPVDSADGRGWTFFVAQDEWLPGLPTFD